MLMALPLFMTRLLIFVKWRKKIFPHECEYCIELMRDESNHEVMRTLLKTELPGILF